MPPEPTSSELSLTNQAEPSPVVRWASVPPLNFTVPWFRLLFTASRVVSSNISVLPLFTLSVDPF